ncbi:hypothetical protein [Indiicoccus explosivorum]|uniref:hypothetical protein n=1 Tax=Indiicoccus explosivorum TaxID=1917864 RepID=UPI000B43D2A7|nr:hypothetical protein [Indiicoccus explosivorum]
MKPFKKENTPMKRGVAVLFAILYAGLLFTAFRLFFDETYLNDNLAYFALLGFWLILCADLLVRNSRNREGDIV